MMRWRYGAENRITRIAGVKIDIGDLVFSPEAPFYGYTVNHCFPVSFDDGAFHWCFGFLGVAMTAAEQGQDVQVATRGVFEFPIEGYAKLDDFVTASYNYSDGPSDAETEVTIEDQLVTVCSEEYAVGQVVKEPYYSDDRYFGKRELCVLIELRSRLCTST